MVMFWMYYLFFKVYSMYCAIDNSGAKPQASALFTLKLYLWEAFAGLLGFCVAH